MSELPKIAQARLRAQSVAAHPDADVLTAFCEQSLSEGERQPVLAHLAACADCREVVALALPPVAATARAHSVINPGTVGLAGWSWSGWMRWASAAACVVVVIAAVMIYKPSPITETPSGSDADVPISHQEIAQASPPTTQPAAPKATEAKAVEADKIAAKAAVPARLDDATAAAESGKRFESVPHGAQPMTPVAAGTGAPLATAKAANGVLARDGTLDSGAGSVGGNAQTQPPQRQAANVPSANSEGGFLPGTINLTTNGQPVTPIGRATGAVNGKVAESPARTNSAASPAAAPVPAADSTLNLQAKVAQQEEPAREYAKKAADSVVAKPAVTPAQWTLSPEGQLQRSLDGGKTQTSVPMLQNAKFTALSALGSEVWAGGAAGLLYHSSDNGWHWTRVKPVASGLMLVSDISQLNFADAQHGDLKTSDGQIWQTSDAGKSWQLQP